MIKITKAKARIDGTSTERFSKAWHQPIAIWHTDDAVEEFTKILAKELQDSIDEDIIKHLKMAKNVKQ